MLQRQTFRSVQRIQWVRAMSALNQSAPQGNTKPQMTNKPVNNNTTSTELQDNLMTSAPLWNENVATESEIDVRNGSRHSVCASAPSMTRANCNNAQ
ncbi:hypothetical protein BCR43DRAFT_128753 [Syncephalastrum racemosum]|uniref:Uncharacterized protein n=1 Tax=Syncephalastrum racemosum TaxID=13706 RepID=A0A1X2HL22_SYNRA|nr:hypothetical protein BCR43DRAFT_128753 [Syncephalastrum racemosum]